MSIFKISAEHDKFDGCFIDDEACLKKKPELLPWETSIALDGTRQGDRWWPRNMDRFHDYPNLGDYVSNLSGDVIIMKRDAIERLRPVLGEIEVLPLICTFGDYWAINVLTLLDCIDYEKAEFVRFRKRSENDNPRIMRFNKFAFRSNVIQNHHVFKIVDAPKSHIFVDDVFVSEVEKQNITGFKFIPVWQG